MGDGDPARQRRATLVQYINERDTERRVSIEWGPEPYWVPPGGKLQIVFEYNPKDPIAFEEHDDVTVIWAGFTFAARLMVDGVETFTSLNWWQAPQVLGRVEIPPPPSSSPKASRIRSIAFRLRLMGWRLRLACDMLMRKRSRGQTGGGT